MYFDFVTFDIVSSILLPFRASSPSFLSLFVFDDNEEGSGGPQYLAIVLLTIETVFPSPFQIPAKWTPLNGRVLGYLYSSLTPVP